MIWFPTEGLGIAGHSAIKNLMNSPKELSSLSCVFSVKLIKKKKRGLKNIYTADWVLDLESIYINREANFPLDSSLKNIAQLFLVAFFFKHHIDMVEVSLCHMQDCQWVGGGMERESMKKKEKLIILDTLMLFSC